MTFFYREAKERMAAENQKMQDKLDKEAADLKKKLQVRKGDEIERKIIGLFVCPVSGRIFVQISGYKCNT